MNYGPIANKPNSGSAKMAYHPQLNGGSIRIEDGTNRALYFGGNRGGNGVNAVSQSFLLKSEGNSGKRKEEMMNYDRNDDNEENLGDDDDDDEEENDENDDDDDDLDSDDRGI